MDTRRLKIWWILLAIPFLIGCPFGEEKCPFNDWERITNIEDLIIISPLKDTFRVGDKVIFKLKVPERLSIWNDSVRLYQQTNDPKPWLILSSKDLFANEFNIELGNRGAEENWFHLEYNPQLDSYLLEIHITFTKIGEYLIATKDRIIFGEQKDCNWYEVRTNIKGSDARGFLEFIVLP